MDLGLKHDDCFEKQDMINRINSFKRPGTDKNSTQDQFRKTQPTKQEAYTSKKPSWQTEDKDEPMHSHGVYFPKEKHISFKILSIGNQEVGKSCLIK